MSRPQLRFVCLILFSFAIAALAQGPQFGSISGQILIVRGTFPPAPVLVTLETRGAAIASGYTNNEGRFGFYGLMANTYHVIVDEPDYAPVNLRVDLDPVGGAVRMLNITLVPKEKPRPVSDDPVSGGNPNVTSSAGLKRYVPDPAVREFKKGVDAEHKKELDSAASHYRKAIELAPDFYEARNNLGSLAVARSDFAAAREQFEAAMKFNPSEPSSYFNLANVFVLTKQPDQAMKVVREGLRLQPQSPFGHFVLGTALGNTGNVSEAEQELRRALELDPKMTKAHLALVNIYLQQQRKESAIAELRTFLQSSPSDPFAPKAREVLKRLETQK